jgi:cation diffusion facilitator family transporter
MSRVVLTRYIWLSIAAAVATIGLKTGAWYLTGSVGLLSDAVESVINLIAAVMAMIMLKISMLPPDSNHEFGHGKAEYFSSLAEGLLIMAAAGGIAYTAAERFINPRPVEQIGVGLFVSLIATVINFTVSRILLTAGKKYRSITLEADAHHLMTDVWTSVAVIGGVGAVGLTGWLKLDSIVAFAVSLNILWTAFAIIKRSVAGLMDASLSIQELDVIERVLSVYRERGVQFHALLTRQGASRRFVSMHILVPGSMSVHDAHHIAEDVERDIRKALPDTVVFTHIEPVDDEISFVDIPIDRG